MSSYNHFGCNSCGCPFNGGNFLGCSSVGSGNEFVYDPNLYSYNKTPNFFNQPPQHQYETYSCELCGDSPHYGFDCLHDSSDCQTRDPLVYELNPSNNYDFPSFDQPPQYHIDDSHQFYCCEHCKGPHYGSDCQTVNVFYEHAPYDNPDSSGFDQPSQFTPPQPLPLSELERKELITYMIESQEQFNINQEKFNMNVQAKINLQEMLHLRNSNQDPPVDLYDLEWSDEGDMEIDSLTKEPLDTLLMGDEIISTTPARENDKFIKSSVDDFVPIPRESEVILVSIGLECGMPIDTPPSPYLVFLGDEKINLLLRDDLDTLLMGDREIDFNPCRDIEELERLLANNHVHVPRVFDEPLGNSDSMSRSIETSDLILEELTTEIGLDDLIPTEINDGYYDSKGDILYFEQLLNEDTSSDLSQALLPTDSSLLVPLHPNFKQTCLREVERFDPFFSLTQSGNMTWMMEKPSYIFPYMPSPRPAAYSPKEVMYCYYHPHLTSGDGFDPEIKSK
ncbi:hypothetical protein Tco_0257170 [Tanacetum coccineum]